jgi:creatinine amidohydrolase
MILEEITMQAFHDGLARTRTIVVPFGSMEEHGQHLSLGTDTIHAYELAKAASRLRPLFVAPPIWYGLCRSTSRHPGTVTITGNTLKLLATELVTSLYQQGLKNFVLLSGHAGGTHLAFLVDAGEQILCQLQDAQIAVLTVLDLIEQIGPGIVETENDAHAGEVETSLMLYLRPDEVIGTSPEEYPAFPKPILVRDKRKFWPGGVWGDPSKASKEKGAMLLEREAGVLAELAARLERFSEEG